MEVTGCGLSRKEPEARLGGGRSDALSPSDVPMEEAADFSEADKSTLMDESDDSGIIPGSHSENALHASEEEEAEGDKAQRYPGCPLEMPFPLSTMVDNTLSLKISQVPEANLKPPHFSFQLRLFFLDLHF